MGIDDFQPCDAQIFPLQAVRRMSSRKPRRSIDQVQPVTISNQEKEKASNESVTNGQTNEIAVTSATAERNEFHAKDAHEQEANYLSSKLI